MMSHRLYRNRLFVRWNTPKDDQAGLDGNQSVDLGWAAIPGRIMSYNLRIFV